MSVIASAIVCTRNRAALLQTCLDRLVDQQLPPEAYDVIVVDNGSTDSTPEVVRQAAARAPRHSVAYVREERTGLSVARNTGLGHAKAEVVSFIDDDAVADPAWLPGLEAVFREHPDGGCVGGRVVPIWEAARPQWLTAQMEAAVDIYNPLDEVGVVDPANYPRGTNCAYRREALDSVGGFDPDLGRKGTLLLSNEDIEACIRLEVAGFKVYYTPHAVVQHAVPASRLSKRFFRRRVYWQGASDRLLDSKHSGRAFVRSRSWRYLARLPYRAALGLWVAAGGTESRGFQLELQCWYMLGYCGLASLWKPR